MERDMACIEEFRAEETITFHTVRDKVIQQIQLLYFSQKVAPDY